MFYANKLLVLEKGYFLCNTSSMTKKSIIIFVNANGYCHSNEFRITSLGSQLNLNGPSNNQVNSKFTLCFWKENDLSHLNVQKE